eukprot:Clim_evm67s210 gene=Clim_evmTU67s210
MGFETSGPDECMVVSGMCHSQPAVITGGRVYVFPCVQRIQRLSLNVMTLNINSPRVYTQMGVPISVSGVAQVKIEGQYQDMLRSAIQQFLGKTVEEIQRVALETLEGHQRAIMGTMTVEEIYQDRQKFATAVFQVASTDLSNMGITIVSYTIKDVKDEQGYLRALGAKRVAEVQRDARIGTAEAQRDAKIREAKANEQKMINKFKNDTEIAEAKRNYELKDAVYKQEMNTKAADAKLAYNLQAAKNQQRIAEEEMQIKVVERMKQIEVETQEIARRDRELESTVKKPALAEKYRLETIAKGEARKMVFEAEAKAETIRQKGEANAFAIREKAKAEAAALDKKAEAYEQYGQAAIVDMVLQQLPKVAAEIAAPLCEANKITMVSSGGGDIGASKLTGEIMDIMTKLPESLNSMIGIDLSEKMRATASQKASATSGGRVK